MMDFVRVQRWDSKRYPLQTEDIGEIVLATLEASTLSPAAKAFVGIVKDTKPSS